MKCILALALAGLLALPAPGSAQRMSLPKPWIAAPSNPVEPDRLLPSFTAPPLPPPELSGAQYAMMTVGGTFGSALGLLSGFVAASAVTLATTGCIDCPNDTDVVDYLLLGAGSSLGTALAVAGVAEEPAVSGFWDGVSKISRSSSFRPALLGAVAGIGTGAVLGGLVGLIAPSDEPYDLVAYNIGQAAASVIAVRLWIDRQRQP